MRAHIGSSLLLAFAGCGRVPPPDTGDGPAFVPETTDTSGPTTGDETAGPTTGTDTTPALDTVDDDGDGYSEAEGDCDDERARTNPGAWWEDCNRIDDDCDGVVDDGCRENGVNAWLQNWFMIEGGVLRPSQWGVTWRDYDGRLLCAYLHPMTDTGEPADVRDCPECEWRFRVEYGTPAWSGDGCAYIDIATGTQEASGRAIEGKVFDHAFSWSWELERGGTTYVLGPTVLWATPEEDDWFREAYNYYPWGSYEVSVVGENVYTYTVYYNPDHGPYTYTPP